MKRITNSGNYDFVICPHCNREDKLPEDPDNFPACAMCGGFGFVMREKRSSKKKTEVHTERNHPVRYSD